MKDVVYEYMNWWLFGWLGVFIVRQGYYILNLQCLVKYLLLVEWNYWYEGKVVLEVLKGIDGKISVKKGVQ